MQPSQPNPPPSDGGRLAGLITAVKGLTFTNVLVIGMLVVIAAPAYLIYRAINDKELLDRFFSDFHEYASQNVGCTLRSARWHGMEMWALSTGLAFQGTDRYLIVVTLDHKPDSVQILSYCETLKTIADKLQGPVLP